MYCGVNLALMRYGYVKSCCTSFSIARFALRVVFLHHRSVVQKTFTAFCHDIVTVTTVESSIRFAAEETTSF